VSLTGIDSGGLTAAVDFSVTSEAGITVGCIDLTDSLTAYVAARYWVFDTSTVKAVG
jgi:hypothetical protein